MEVQFKVGTIVKIKVTSINREEKCIEVEPVDPWEIREYNRGEVLIGRVAALREPFAFISIKPGIIGRTAYRNTDKYKKEKKMPSKKSLKNHEVFPVEDSIFAGGTVMIAVKTPAEKK